MNLFITPRDLVPLLTRWSILLHHLDLRVVVRGQKHVEDKFVLVVFVQLLVNQHQRVVLHLLTFRNDGSQETKRGHAPFKMARREVHRRLNFGLASLYMQNPEAQLKLKFCGNISIT